MNFNRQTYKIVLIVAIALVLGVLWSKWDAKYGDQSPAASQGQTQTANANSQVPNLAVKTQTASSAASTDTGSVQPVSLKLAKQMDADGETVTVNTGLLNLSINLEGGNLVKATLPKFATSIKDKTPVQLFSNKVDEFYVAQSGLVGKGTDKLTFKAKQEHYQMGANKKLIVDLYAQTKNGLLIDKQYTFYSDRYLVSVDYKITNKGSKTWDGRFYGQLLRVPPKKHKHSLLSSYTTFTGAAVSTTDEHFEKLSFSDMADTNFQQTTSGGWAAMVQHYFMSAWIPVKAQQNEIYSRVFGNQTYGIGIANPAISVDPGKTVTTGAQLYVGPTESHRLEAIAPYLNLTVDYGWLWFISEFLFFVMAHIYQLVGNWGVSILLVTLLIKIVFYPLSAKSYRSMAKMRMLQPKMKMLKEQHGSDKQALGRATMELYRSEKVNPLSGCLPILIQIPVFIGLYWMLMASVELRQAPFIFWIKDLSVHDPYYVLPILMGLSMFVQQRLNPPPPDPTQAKVMMALPVVFTVLFLGFPAGLVLYWLCNNCVSILQQWYVLKKCEKEGLGGHHKGKKGKK